MPAIFGLHIASYIICQLANKPLENPLANKNRRKVYEKMWRDFLRREEKIAGHALK